MDPNPELRRVEGPSSVSPPNAFSRIWLLALICAGLPAAFVIYQLWIYFDEAFPHLYFSRTLPALVAVALGFAGLSIPLWVFTKRREFRNWDRLKAWRTFVIIAVLSIVGYLLPFLVLVDASRNSVAVLPYTHSVYLIYSAEHDVPNRPFQFGVAGGPGTGHGGTRGQGDRVVRTWTAPLVPRHVWGVRDLSPDVELRCEFTDEAPTSMIDITVVTPLPVNFDTVGLLHPQTTYGGKVTQLPMRLNAGTHRFQITATPQ